MERRFTQEELQAAWQQMIDQYNEANAKADEAAEWLTKESGCSFYARSNELGFPHNFIGPDVPSYTLYSKENSIPQTVVDRFMSITDIPVLFTATEGTYYYEAVTPHGAYLVRI